MVETVMAWIWQPIDGDRRVGLVQLTRQEFAAMGDRVQDIVAAGGLSGLKPIAKSIPAPAPVEASSSSSSSPSSSTRRRRSAPAAEA